MKRQELEDLARNCAVEVVSILVEGSVVTIHCRDRKFGRLLPDRQWFEKLVEREKTLGIQYVITWEPL